jgi:hypothetical protein
VLLKGGKQASKRGRDIALAFTQVSLDYHCTLHLFVQSITLSIGVRFSRSAP